VAQRSRLVKIPTFHFDRVDVEVGDIPFLDSRLEIRLCRLEATALSRVVSQLAALYQCIIMPENNRVGVTGNWWQ
jgi:hypothetical protein